jgi:three-Cys-motif partner protein
MIEVLQGDFNKIVDTALSFVKPKQAAFCLLDQRTFECQWNTVVRVAQHKRVGSKVEIFYFLPVGWLARAISGLKHNKKVSEWWARDDWKTLHRLKPVQLGQIAAQRFTDELGYEYASAWPIYQRKGGGKVLYYMVHASDHPLAPGLMQRAYRKALDQPEPPEQFQMMLKT